MNSFFNNLNEREQWMVFSAIICIIVYSYYFFLYQPLSTQVEQKSAQLIEKTETLEWMTKVQNNKNTLPQKKNIGNGELLTLVSTQLKSNPSLNVPYQIQQTNSGDLQLTFEEIPFIFFIEWLINLNNNYIFNVKQMDINKTTTPGITRLMVVLSS